MRRQICGRNTRRATRAARSAGTAGDEGPRLCVGCTAWAAICERDIGVFWLDGPAPAAYRSQTLPPEKLSPLANRRNASPDSHSCSTVVPCSYFSPFFFFRLLLVAASTMSSADAKPLPFVYQFAAGKLQCRVPVELRAGSVCVWIFRRARGMGAGSAIACNCPVAWSLELLKSHL